MDAFDEENSVGGENEKHRPKEGSVVCWGLKSAAKRKRKVDCGEGKEKYRN